MLLQQSSSAPEEIWVSAGEWELIVGWSPVISGDFHHYVLYRKQGKNGEWEKIVNKPHQMFIR